jgi:SMC interacting uncharacterized protein involved in chromosome segregation
MTKRIVFTDDIKSLIDKSRDKIEELSFEMEDWQDKISCSSKRSIVIGDAVHLLKLGWERLEEPPQCVANQTISISRIAKKNRETRPQRLEREIDCLNQVLQKLYKSMAQVRLTEAERQNVLTYGEELESTIADLRELYFPSAFEKG